MESHLLSSARKSAYPEVKLHRSNFPIAAGCGIGRFIPKKCMRTHSQLISSGGEMYSNSGHVPELDLASRNPIALIDGFFGQTVLGMQKTSMEHSEPVSGRLPIPELNFDSSARVERFRYSVTSICCHGELSERAPMRLLGWNPGHQIRLDIKRRVIAAFPDADGAHKIGKSGRLRLPAAIRHQCGIEPGDKLFVAVSSKCDAVIVYPLVVIDLALADLHRAARSCVE
ncbi:AbrB/MazE/SpoVT family DNA-binding domain-containing protein [Nocardia panacis]|uniref:AbrB/MazE/SpoVT family DNA-binding domain-containing protein n=1 Tax=Nocardia panacis TaxID=2340916 RepID=UPI0011C389DA|nr:AbrB/MazE/SpoVT family DNA-binding domain-containing protein [Nocardia panacis]